MKWGVRKQYEGTGRSGGGGWGPNIIGGAGPSPLAASMAGNPKKKTSVGKSEAKKAGLDVSEKAARDMKKDINSWIDNKINSARSKDTKNKKLPKGARSLSTGENYDKALENLNKEQQAVLEKHMPKFDQFSKEVDAYNLSVLRGNKNPDEYKRLASEEARIKQEYLKDATNLINRHSDEFNAATLRDLGYDEEHVSAGVEYLKKNNKRLFKIYDPITNNIME